MYIRKNLPMISPMVLPFVYRPVGFPPDALKSIPLGWIFALDNVDKQLLFPASTRESPKIKEAPDPSSLAAFPIQHQLKKKTTKAAI